MASSQIPAAKKDEKGRNIQVVVRCRPFNTVERKSASHTVVECDQNKKELTVRTGGATDKSSRKTYTFDMVFGPSAKQIDVYRSVVCPILDEVIMGYNCTIFAYGQTGTGKTFTMEGDRSPNEEFTWEEDPLAGIIPRTLHQIFEKLSNNGTEFSVKVSLLEIYNEELFDLLSPAPDVTERLQLFDDPRNKRGVTIKGLEEVTVHNKNEVYQILERGAAKRKTASTLMNAYSSRSHSVFSVTIHMKEITLDGEELVKIGKLNLVDLAGSENIGRSGAVDKRAREAGNINQSLLTLGRVIKALVERGPHVPYRESKLTRILQDSLGGRTKTSIIATVSPASINLEETLSTLDYANRAKSIMNKPEVNQKLTKRTLIKEYTEEIERLKRDLAATRDKHGVYLSLDNYENINSKLLSQEEQITEYNDRIAAMEEELKKIVDLFTDSKQKLDQCTEDLQEKSQKLEETQKDLTETRHRLTQEEFIALQLQSNESQLYSTADQLLSTAEASTHDVSGLHAKLQRKKEVEHHNGEVQESFAQRMENCYNSMQTSLQEQSHKHAAMIDFYRSSVGELLNTNCKVFKETLGAVSESYGSIKETVGEVVEQCKERVLRQEKLSQEAQNSMLEILDEHKQHLEKVLLAQAVPGIRSVIATTDSLKQTFHRYHTLNEQMRGLKAEMMSVFDSYTESFASMRECAMQGFSTLRAEHDKLKQQISQAENSHQAHVAELVQCLQNQLNLLAMNTQTDFKGVSQAASAPIVSLETLESSIQSKCTATEEQHVSARARLGSSVDGVMTEMNGVTEEGERTLEECIGYCGLLQTSLDSLAESGLAWCHEASNATENKAQEQLTLIRETDTALQDLRKSVEEKGKKAVQDCEARLTPMQQEVEVILSRVELQTGKDDATMQEHKEILSCISTLALDTVHNFISSELRQDLPTGTTPQRREYTYPRVLNKPRSREELAEEFRAQQEELQCLLSQCETVIEGEEKPLDQDSLEDEVSVSSDGNINEQSCSDENLTCFENGRVPFFKVRHFAAN
ncbi:P-loop containing nucleoside triphosphate hydrolases superfamily protein [Pimephales promelas]|nr:P-loop containing nucleoside triphosphate hydrolases superfamily protein [Pimephales promelas]KAG1972873.1 P-loop containing nucleoside triphosphate hydrolases superfamily protein [Pimephales promelas]